VRPEKLQDFSGRKRKAHEKAVALENVAALPPRNDLQPDILSVKKPIAALIPAKRRVRKETPEQLERVMRSIQEFGVMREVIIDTNNVIVAGHLICKAAQKLGLKEIQCRVVSHLTPELIRQFRIADNRLGETGEWDLPELGIEMLELSELNLDLSSSGFTVQEIDQLIVIGQDVDAPSPSEDEEPEPYDDAFIVSRSGDLYRMDDHRLLCGDSLAWVSYQAVLEGTVAQCVFSDPPYNCPIEGNVGGLGKHKHGDFAMAVGEMTDKAFIEFLRGYLEQCKAMTAPGAVIFACMDWRQVDLLMIAGRIVGLERINKAVWNKGSGGMGSLYRSAYEEVVVFCNGKTPTTNNVELGKHGRNRTNVWNYAGANRKGSSASSALAGHPTPKPIELIADALLDVSVKGDRVIDPFMGSGTTLIAAERTGRIAHGIELDPKYVDLAIRRWEKETGRSAVHAETGLTFAELAEERMTEEDE